MSSSDSDGVNGPVQKPRAEVTVEAEGRLTVGVRLPLPASARPRLLLQLRPKKGKPEGTGHYVELESAGPDQWRAVLEAAPALEEGHWDAYVVGAPGEERTPLLPGLRDLRALVSGGGDGRATPVAVRIPYATKDGRLAVRAWWRAMHAEAGRIVLADGSMAVTARLFGARLGEGATATVHRRGQGSVVRQIALRAEGGQEFSFTVDYKELVAEGGGPGAGEAPVFWDVYVRPATGAPRIRVGRLLDDIAERKAVFVYPAALLDGVSARPYYTVDNDLSVEVAPRRTG
ncbi:hypothetical protein [Streptomyces sp. NBC_01022]|uniref:hypothetical protein n=1 Tax=Streptomyces sp. NBC_01022 TaxID=2903723 RepID=UPI002DDA5A98|nr:hypothetical protein [Streptomyces sp. NBC_01022]WRZ80183.1 hypothetical protein OG316_07885 [Streptomyces sp. NBC_01022]